MRLPAVDLPGYAELIYEHAKTDGPESPLERHLHGSVFGERFKDAFCLRWVGDGQQHVETPGLFILLRKHVGAHGSGADRG
jgi:hypothetical protein